MTMTIGCVETVGQRLRAIREQKRISGAKLSRALGYGRNQVSQWERDIRPLAARDIERIAEILGVSPRELFGSPTAPSPSDSSPLNAAPASPDTRSGVVGMEQDPDAEPMVPLRMLDDALQVAKDNAQAVKAMVAQVQTLIDRLPEPQTVSLPAQGDQEKKAEDTG